MQPVLQPGRPRPVAGPVAGRSLATRELPNQLQNLCQGGLIAGGLVLSAALRRVQGVAKGRIRKQGALQRQCHRKAQDKDVLSIDLLHRPLDENSTDLRAWCRDVFDVANKEFFDERLEEAVLTVDESWHERGGAGGAHPSTNRIVLDPSVHTCYTDLCGTLLHEMLHLQLGSIESEEEHGPMFLRACLKLNDDLLKSGRNCFCRLGEFDAVLDKSLLLEAGVPETWCASLLGGIQRREVWDSGLLAGDLIELSQKMDDQELSNDEKLQQAKQAKLLAARIRCMSIINACKIALKLGYTTWSVKSRTIARHFASATGRDYVCFSDYKSLWSLWQAEDSQRQLQWMLTMWCSQVELVRWPAEDLFDQDLSEILRSLLILSADGCLEMGLVLLLILPEEGAFGLRAWGLTVYCERDWTKARWDVLLGSWNGRSKVFVALCSLKRCVVGRSKRSKQIASNEIFWCAWQLLQPIRPMA